jgi:cobalt-zinc-cadmium efflux system outer membrane protein
MKSIVLIFTCLACFSLIQPVFGRQSSSDTLSITIKQAEEQFVKSNLSLIAGHYNIDNATAQLTTARLFNNPNLSFSNGIYATDVSQGPAYKEQSFGISQLLTTAGKRNKNIQLAKLGITQSKYQFFDLLRTLKFTLRSDFYTIYYQQQSAKVYNEEISSLTKTLAAYREQYAKGNIAEKELLRIQAQLYSLQVEYTGLITGIDTTESQLQLLLRLPPRTVVTPVVDSNITNNDLLGTVTYQQLLDSAYANRYDYKLSKLSVDYNSVNLQLQKATAVPDISLSVNFDRLGGYGNNFLGGGISFDLPFFNRNQGGIKQARIAIDQSKVQLQSQQDQVESDVATNYKIALTQEKLAGSFDPKFKPEFSHLIAEVYKNYEKRNIGLLEFLDYYDTYKTNTLLINNQLLSRIIALEQLNYVTGTPFFNQQ